LTMMADACCFDYWTLACWERVDWLWWNAMNLDCFGSEPALWNSVEINKLKKIDLLQAERYLIYSLALLYELGRWCWGAASAWAWSTIIVANHGWASPIHRIWNSLAETNWMIKSCKLLNIDERLLKGHNYLLTDHNRLLNNY
jgi:hypothetical protein